MINKRTFYRMKERFSVFLNLRSCFRKMSFLLENGQYYAKDRHFQMISDHTEKNPLRMFNVYSDRKYQTLYTEGQYYFTQYHYTFVFDDYTYQIDKGMNRYDDISRRINLYKDRIPYHGMNVSTCDEYRMIISETVHGDNEYNHKGQFRRLFPEIMVFLFASLRNAEPALERMKMKDGTEDVYFCVQHGDLHYDNVIITKDGPVLIDYDDIDYYPLFYDVFFCALHNKHFDAFNYFRSESFTDLFKETCEHLKIEYDEETIDFYLSACLYYYRNVLEERKGFPGLDYYLEPYMHGDHTGFPLTQEALDAFPALIKKYSIPVKIWQKPMKSEIKK